jgi:RHS repeat-associated protein
MHGYFERGLSGASFLGRSGWRLAAVWLALAALVAPTAMAQRSTSPDATPGGGGGGTTPVTTYYEQGILIRSGETVEALGPNLMGDSVNEYSGGLEFSHTDVSLPGNNALPVAVGRHLATGTRQTTLGTGLFGDWDLEIPHLRTIAAQAQPNWYGGGLNTPNLYRCSQFLSPPWSSVVSGGKSVSVYPYIFWDGYRMYIPGAGDQTMLSRYPSQTTEQGPANPIQPTDGGVYPVLTKQNWQISCLPTLDSGTGGEGFLARSPDGTRYQFDHLAVRAYPQQKLSFSTGAGYLPRVEVWVLPTLITDRFGNWVRYTYGSADGWRVASITSSDGRVISFTYNGNGNRIQSVNDGTRTWSYGYSGNGTLQTVTLPDASRWQFALDALETDPFSSPDPECDTESGWGGTLDYTALMGTMTHPSGATGSFTLKMTAHGRSDVPGTQTSCSTPTANLVSRYFASRSLSSKTLSGPGMPTMTWLYAYGPAVGSFAPCSGCVNTKTVTITDPLSNITVNTYGTQYGINEGLLLNSAEGFTANGSLRGTGLAYQPANAGPYPAKVGYLSGSADSMSRIYTPQSQQVISQQGVTFTNVVTQFDAYARAVGWNKSSSLGYGRAESTSLFDQTSLWMLGQVKSRVIAGIEAESTTFNTSNALPINTSKFGKLQATYAFNADGTLYSVKDGLNQTTTFSNYMRGLPQHIVYPDTRTMDGVVHNIGVITSVTNEAGKTWSFGYDAMGRIARKTAPTGDPVAYNNTLLSFVQVPAAEYGLEPNHWRQTITTGNAVTINYFDARWRKRITITYDAANPGATQRMQRFDYDPYNRTTFAAYPARSITSITAATPGTTTVYEPLGRVSQTRADSELGVLTTTTQYLAGFQKQVTNPRGYSSTTAYQIFDEPSESAITSITAPESVSVAIGRDAFGKPLSITRSGPYAGSGPASVTRSYVYDQYQLLCKTIEPEIGATIQSLDAANNVSWRAIGLALTGTGSCDTASVGAASKISYGYDARNRLLNTSFGDGSPAITRTYTPDGLPETVTSNGSTWTYGYNNRRLLSSEVLNNNGAVWGFGYGYDANAHTSQLNYPDGAAVGYAPNALGEATVVSGYASAVSYHPNGAVAGYTLGNGIVHSLTQNTRGLPLVNRDAGVMQDQYGFDANGNIAAITDQQEGISSRSMGYDGLDRLTVANAPGVWGNATYGYDALDNVRTSVVGSRNSAHNYDANNRLSSINTNGSYTAYVYNSQGNVTGRGTQGFYFDQGNRMQLANGVASYTYDGLGRRTSITSSGILGATSRLQAYSQSGQLLFGQQKQGSLVTNTRYVYLGGKEIAETNITSSGSNTSYVHTDALGSPVARTNAIGALINRTRYEAYGKTAAGTVPNGIGFTGHVNDPDTGLVYMQQRYYDPIAARFMSVDPVTTDASTGAMFNVYEYANNNPYRYTDPDGREGQQSVTIKLPPPTGSSIPSTVTISSNGSVTTTNMGMSPGSGGITISQRSASTGTGGATNSTSPSQQSGTQMSSTVGGVQRGTTLNEASTYGATGRAAVATAIAAETGAVVAGAGSYGYAAIGTTWRAIIGFLRGVHGDALPPPKPPELPTVGPPQIVQPAASPSPPPPLIAR